MTAAIERMDVNYSTLLSMFIVGATFKLQPMRKSSGRGTAVLKMHSDSCFVYEKTTLEISLHYPFHLFSARIPTHAHTDTHAPTRTNIYLQLPQS